MLLNVDLNVKFNLLVVKLLVVKLESKCEPAACKSEPKYSVRICRPVNLPSSHIGTPDLRVLASRLHHLPLDRQQWIEVSPSDLRDCQVQLTCPPVTVRHAVMFESSSCNSEELERLKAMEFTTEVGF